MKTFSERVGNGAVDPDQVEDYLLLVQLVHLHLEVAFEALEREGVVEVMRGVRACVLDGGSVARCGRGEGDGGALLLQVCRQAVGLV